MRKISRWVLSVVSAGLAAVLLSGGVTVVRSAALEANSEKVARVAADDLGPENFQSKH